MSTASPHKLLRAIEAAIHIDEVGIWTGRWRDWFIKSAYAPFHAPVANSLLRQAVEAITTPLRDGRARGAGTLWKAAGPDRAFLRCLSLVLHVANHANIGDDRVRLVLDCRVEDQASADMVIETIGALPDFCPQSLSPRDMLCVVGSAHDAGVTPAQAVARCARRHGAGVVLENFGAGQDAPDLLRRLVPDMVRLDPGLFGAISTVPQGRGLLAALVESLHAGDMEVALGGIARREQLEAALAAGVDLVGGSFLGKPALAGTLIGDGKIDLAPPGENVVYLRRRPAS